MIINIWKWLKTQFFKSRHTLVQLSSLYLISRMQRENQIVEFKVWNLKEIFYCSSIDFLLMMSSNQSQE